jgi:hypothetical protein
MLKEGSHLLFCARNIYLGAHRSVFVLQASALLHMIICYWIPMPTQIFNLTANLPTCMGLHALAVLGFLLVSFVCW